MAKMIQIRDVPDDVHRILKARAAQDGMSLSSYLKVMLRDAVAQLTMDEWFARVLTRKNIAKKETAAQMIRAIRDSR